jgi:hypothetical protein
VPKKVVDIGYDEHLQKAFERHSRGIHGASTHYNDWEFSGVWSGQGVYILAHQEVTMSKGSCIYLDIRYHIEVKPSITIN